MNSAMKGAGGPRANDSAAIGSTTDVAIDFQNVVKRFGSRTVLRGINLEVRRGEIVFILGTSGTGKSVLLKTLVGLLRADEGKILIEGQDVAQLSEADYLPIRRHCGMVFQHPALFDSMTVGENVAFGLMKHERKTYEQALPRVRECMEQVGLSGVEDRMVNEISYGMQKRVSLARTLAVGPRILLFDEPTTGLDPITTRQINNLIRDLSHRLQTTALVVSHDMECALTIADRIIVLSEGQIVEQGTVEQILRSKVPLVVDFLAEANASRGES